MIDFMQNFLVEIIHHREEPMKILITGGAGYIGSTIASALEDNGHVPIILDSLVKGHERFTHNRIFFKGDISDKTILERIFTEHPDINLTIHCAAQIVVPESVENPYKYYHENIYKSVELLHNLERSNKKRVIFSSSASMYNLENTFIAEEDSPIGADSPYAFTKIVIEQALADFVRAYNFRVISLRYFNPIGADPAFRSGPYDPNPSHLLGALGETASGKREVFEITGVDWPTRDGSAIRDYIHVWDLAQAHVKAVERFDEVLEQEDSGYSVINLGSERGTTVKEFVGAFETVIGKKLNKRESAPRQGDKIGAYACSVKALDLLGWKCELTIPDGIRHALQWNEKRREVLGY